MSFCGDDGVVGGGVVGVGVVGWCVQSFCVQPNCSVEFVLCCRWVVTIYQWMIPTDRDFHSKISLDASI